MNKLFLLLLGMIVISLSCTDDSSEYIKIINSNILYRNSFESTVDTIGWITNSSFELRNDAPKEGDYTSLFVSGGCMVPHAYIDLILSKKDNYIRLNCWGKKLINGGTVYLQILGTQIPNISISVMDSV
jgi:hypothetical protein